MSILIVSRVIFAVLTRTVNINTNTTTVNCNIVTSRLYVKYMYIHQFDRENSKQNKTNITQMNATVQKHNV